MMLLYIFTISHYFFSTAFLLSINLFGYPWNNLFFVLRQVTQQHCCCLRWHRSHNSSYSLIVPQTKRLRRRWNRRVYIYHSDDVSAESCEPSASAWFIAADCWQFMSWFSPSSAAYVFPFRWPAGTTSGVCKTTLPFCLFKWNISHSVNTSWMKFWKIVKADIM